MLLLTGVWKISHMLLNIRKRRLDATVLISCEASNACYLSSSILHILNIHERFFFVDSANIDNIARKEHCFFLGMETTVAFRRMNLKREKPRGRCVKEEFT